MFEEIHKLGESAAAAAAAHEFTKAQDTATLAEQQELRESLVLETRAENLVLLKGLTDIGEQLHVPDLLAELSRGVIAAHPRFRNVALRTEPFSWMPHAPSAIYEDLTMASKVRAIHGWHLEWENTYLPSATILLYQQRTLGEMPRLAVVPGETEALRTADHRGRIDILLRSESAIAYRYKRLQSFAQTQSYEVLTDAERAHFVAEEQAISTFLTDDSTDIRTIEHEFAQKVDYFTPVWTKKAREDDAHSTALFGLYEAAAKRLRNEELASYFGNAFIHPDDLHEPTEVFESRRLECIDEAFSAPGMRRSIFGFKTKVPGGAIGEHSWTLDGIMTPSALQLERQNIAEKLQAYYLPHLTQPSISGLRLSARWIF